MDLSKVSTEDLEAFQAGRLQDVSTEGLEMIQAAKNGSTGPSALASFARQGYQGLTMNFGDEAIDFLGAAGASALSPDLSFSDAYDEARGMSKQELSADKIYNPGLSLAGNVAGGVITGGGIVQGTAKYAPKTASALASFAEANPYISSSVLGGATGLVPGFGGGKGSFADRASEAIVQGVGGALIGPVATYGLRNVAGPAIEKGSSALARIAPSKEVAPIPLGVTSKPDGELFSKTLGERTQQASAQTIEADALGGRYGDEASGLVRSARNIQNDERRKFIEALSPRATDPNAVNDVLESTYQRISKNAEEMGKSVTHAYDIARQGNSVNIKAGDIQNGLLGEIGRIRNETGANLSDKINYSKSRAALNALTKKIKGAEGSTITSVKLGDLEDWRKTLTGYANDATGTEKAFLSKVRSAYDDFMIKTASEAVDVGDKEAIQAFRNAVGIRKQYGDLFEKNKIVESIALGKTPDDFVKDLIGSGSIAGKKNMLSNASALIKAGGNESDLVKTDLADAFAKRIYDRAADGFVNGQPDVRYISPVKMANELDALFVKNKELGELLYGKDAGPMARKAISELKLIGSKQPGTQNPSGSGYAVMRVLRATGLTNVWGLSLLNDISQSATRASGLRATEKALSDFAVKKPVARSKLFSAIGGVTGGAASSNIPLIEVTPRR